MLARSFRASKSFALLVVCIAVVSDVFTYGIIVPVMPFALTERLSVPESDIQKWTSVLLGVLGIAILIGSSTHTLPLCNRIENLRLILPIFYGMYSHFRPSQPLRSLGQIDKLPLELLSEVLLDLDVPTLVAFRCVNRHALAVVDSLPKFCRVLENCANVIYLPIRAVVATKAKSFTFNTLHNSLSMRDCIRCGRFGGYLYLITCERVCYFCFSQDTAYFPITESAARRIGCTKNHLEQLPHLFSLPDNIHPLKSSPKEESSSLTG